MKLLTAITAALLPVTTFAAKKSSTDRFDTFRAKTAPFKLDDASYGKLTNAPRDYAVAVLLTALKPQFGCQLCRDFEPEWELLARSWTKGDKKGESRLLFGTLDFVDGKGTFQSVWPIYFA